MARKDARFEQGATAPNWKSRLGWITLAAFVILSCIAIRYAIGPPDASAQAPTAATQPAAQQIPTSAKPAPGTVPSAAAQAPPENVVALVNRQQISRQALAEACVKRFGKEVLESLVNKHLIQSHCQQRGLTVTDAEIETEIQRLAEKFNLGVEQYLALLEKERGIKKEEYARDILWPTLALRKLSADQLSVTPQEVEEAYQANFGPAVKARLITVEDVQLAQRLRATVTQRPDEFPDLARKYSTDIGSASIGGMIQPIRRYVGDPEIERVAFQMKEGEISSVIRVGGQHALLKCEGHLDPQRVPIERVRANLEEQIKSRKLRGVAGDVFEKLQASAQVDNIFNDPDKSRAMPGIAATVNGYRIFTRDLAQEAVARHGEEVLEAEINKLLFHQELQKNNLQVTKADIEAEIAHAAELAGALTPSGKPDIQHWIEMVTEQQGLTYELYVQDVVWPSAALKKLVQANIQISQEDLQKGFEANYGARVRCRAIVISNLRRAQEVWDKARQHQGDDLAVFFGKLAAQYSEEASSRALDGEVPPLRKHGGQPVLEREAFKLQPGDISGVIQVGERFVILYCEGFTEAMQVNLAEVRPMIERDLVEKKTRIAMAEQYDQVREGASIVNYLAGTSQSPKKTARAAVPPTR